MITLIKSDGTIVLTQPTRVYQGSSISEVVLLGGVAQNLIPEISFKLPQSGVYTPFDYMTSANIPTGEGISAWSYTIPLAVTQEYGQTDFQIRIKDTNGKVVASGLCSFEVERGVPPDTSEIPDIDPFNTLKEIIESIQGDIENSWFESKGILPYDVAYSYKQNALIYNKDEQGNYRFYCSLTDNNSGNELTDATKWTSVPIMLETDVNGKISAHNTSNTAHQDIRSLISTLTSRVTQNENDIATNTGNIQQNTLAIGNLRTQVEANASLIADTRNNLANNYYTKSQTYTKDEVKSLLGTAAGFQFVIVDELPEQGDPTKIYLVPITQSETRAAVVENSYFEYIWLSAESRYENIGSTQIDLSNYFTKDEITNLLSPIQESISTLETDNATNKVNISSLQSNKLDKNQGQGNAGKILGIDSDGNVIPQEAPKEIVLKYSSFVQAESFIPNTDLWSPTADSNSLGIGYIDMNVKINFIGLTSGSPTMMYQTATADGNGYLLQAINLGTGTNHDTLQIMSSTNLGGQTINISPDAATINDSNILTENTGLQKNQGQGNSGKMLQVDEEGNLGLINQVGISVNITDEMLINTSGGMLPDEEYKILTENNSNTLILTENDIPIVLSYQGTDVDNSNLICYTSINGINKIKRILIAKSISSSSIGDGHLFTIQNLTYMPDVEIWKQIYPIGAVYISVNNTNPETLFGGTWEALPEGFTLFTTTTTGQGGEQIEAGLPNITGNVSGFSIGAQFDNTPPTGAFIGSSKISTGANTWGSSNGDRAQVNFNASQSNSVYGKSNTVQPPAIKVYMWRRVN